MTDREPDNRFDERLRETLQPVPLSDRQRRRHRARLANLSSSARPPRSGRLEFALVAVALLFILATAGLWSALGSDDGDDAADDNAIAAQPPTATPDFEMESLDMGDETIEPDRPPQETWPGLHMETTPPPVAAVCSASTTEQPPMPVQVSASFPVWYGDPAGELWVAPADLSVFRTSVAQMPPGGVAWYAGAPSVIQVYGTPGPLLIRGERGDGGETFEAQPETQPDDTGGQRASFTIPTPGCWSLSVSDGRRELAIAVDVLPRELRPDLIFLEQVEAIRPYDPPLTCAVTPLTGPEMRGEAIVFRYWMEQDGIAVDVEQGWYVAGRDEHLNIVGDGVDGSTRVSARLSGEGAREIAPARQEEADAGQLAVMIFPEPGCWELNVESIASSATFTAYVYPEACVPDSSLEGVPPACAAPRSSYHSVMGAGFAA